MKSVTYKDSGVDIDEGNRLVRIIKQSVKSTFRPEVKSDIGGFGALFKPDLSKYSNPVFVSGTDGVGTKLKIANIMDKHDTVGIDLVAMTVNDIVVQGAEPLFFLDYFATGKLDAEKAAQIIEGIAEGCKQAGCALIGGETAEMPGFYQADEYDLAGFCVGIVDQDKIIDGSTIKKGDQIIGLGSTGPHSNGYSLIRKLFYGEPAIDYNNEFAGKTIGEWVLEPTRIYVKTILTLIKKFNIKGIVHITGGGFQENIPRIIPSNLGATIDVSTWVRQEIFSFIQALGNITDYEMFRTFNCGIGMILIVDKNDCTDVINKAIKLGEKAFHIGEVNDTSPNSVTFINAEKIIS